MEKLVLNEKKKDLLKKMLRETYNVGVRDGQISAQYKPTLESKGVDTCVTEIIEKYTS